MTTTTTRFKMSKAFGRDDLEWSMEVDSKGKAMIPLEDALRVLGAKPMDVIDMFAHEPRVVNVLLRMEMDRITKASVPKPKPVCASCSAVIESPLRCSACIKVRVEVLYCCKECQKADWKAHKKTCGLNVKPEAQAAFQAKMKGFAKAYREAK